MRIFVCVMLLLGCVGLAWGHGGRWQHYTPSRDHSHRINHAHDGGNRHDHEFKHNHEQHRLNGTAEHWAHHSDTVESSHEDEDDDLINTGISDDNRIEHVPTEKEVIEENTEDSVDEPVEDTVVDPVETTTNTPVKTTTNTPVKTTTRTTTSTTANTSVVYVSYTTPTHTVVVLPEPAEQIEQDPVKVVVEQEIEPVEVVVPPIPKEYHDIQFYGGMNFVSIPVSTYGIQTVSDFWNQYTFLQDLNGIIFVYVDGEWLNYAGDNTVVGDIPLTPYTALAVSLNSASLLGLDGIPFEKESTIQLDVGVNFVGFPTLPIGVVYPSDLIELGACAVVVTIEGKLYIVGRAGDDGDVEIQPNQALFVITKNPIQLVFEEVAAAPMAPRAGNSIMTWGDVKNRGGI